MIIATDKPKRLVLIDGKSVFYRGYYAMPGLSTKDGTPTGGVYGFTALSLDVIKKLDPDYVAVAWDKPKTNIRNRLEIYPAYKAGRKPAPPDFYAQIPVLHELLNTFGWPLYELDDYEADDIMAGLAKKANDEGIEVILVTGDYDSLQLLNKLTHVYLPQKGFNIELFKEAAFEQKYGIKVEQFLDYKSLVGDSSDNIPGVPGVGEVAARNLLNTYKTLDDIYDNIDLISGAVQKKLVAGKASAYMSKKLATLYKTAPIDLDLNAMDVHNYDPTALRDELKKLEFKSLIQQVPDAVDGDGQKVEAIAAPTDDIKLPKLISLEKFDAANKPIYIQAFCKYKQGFNPYCLVLGTEDQVTLINIKNNKIEDVKVVDMLKSAPLIGYDVKTSLKALMSTGINNKNVVHDVQIADFLLDSLSKTKSLSELAEQQLDHNLPDIDDIPPEDIGTFAPEIIGVLLELTKQQQKKLKSTGKLEELAKKIEWPVIPVLAEMEFTGIALNIGYLEAMSIKLQDEISDIEQTIYGYANQEFNISSPQQLSKVLFDDMELPSTGIKKGKTGLSTAANELDKLRGLNPIVNAISEYREFTKLKSTYVDTLPNQAGPDGRLHTTFSLTVAQTGRLSSSDPNLQNIPVRSELGRSIRTAFEAGPGNVFVSADYSQFELRLAAVMANDTNMIEVFNSGEDIHVRTAAEVYGIALDDVTKDQRSAAKTINFGVLYGMSPHGLSAATGMTHDDAKEFIDRYFATRQPLVDYISKLRSEAKENGYVETIFGRRRLTPDVKSANFVVREAAYRQAVNMPIQGTEADLMKLAMIEVNKKLPEGCNQLLQIHDSILVECPENKVDEVSVILKDTMENIYPELGINLAVDINCGQNWGEL